MADLELRARTPYESLYRISGSLRPDSLAGIDAWGWYVLPAHLRPLFAALIFLMLTLFDRRPDFVFIYSPRVKDEGLKTWLENRLYDRFSRFSGTHRSRHPLLGLAFLSPLLWNFHGPFSLSSMRSLTCQPRVFVNPGSPPHLSQIDTFYGILGGESVATIRLLSALYLRPLTAFSIADFHQSNWFRVFCDRLLRIVKSMVILINIKKYFYTRERNCVYDID